MIWGHEPRVLYPPIIISDFKLYANKSFNERDNALVMIGRISPEKNIEKVINAVALTNTKPIIRVIGGLISSANNYYKFLIKLARRVGVKLEFYTNVPRWQLVELVTSSRVFVHTTVGEHFGIAVVEAMAAGCPVIVHKSGGPYEDIIDKGKYGIYAETIEEYADAIDRLLENQEEWHKYHKKSLERASFFSEEKFSNRMLEIIRNHLL